jgi:hypothetical protein
VALIQKSGKPLQNRENHYLAGFGWIFLPKARWFLPAALGRQKAWSAEEINWSTESILSPLAPIPMLTVTPRASFPFGR